MKSRPHFSLDEVEWLNVLFSFSAKVFPELAGYHSRLVPEAGWDTGPRRIDEHLIYFVSEGRFSAVLDGKRIWPSAGSLCWICPTTPFRFFYGTRDPSPVIHRFRFKVEKGGKSLQPKWPYRFLPEAWRILDTIAEIIREAERPGKFGPWRIRTLISHLSIQVFEASPSQKRKGTFLSDAQRTKIAALLSENTVLRRTPTDLAKLLGYSSSYFTRVFRRSYGLPPRKWLLQQRLRHAAVLLRESNNRISEVAERLGYAETYLFSRQFRQMFGMSPKQWKNDVI